MPSDSTEIAVLKQRVDYAVTELTGVKVSLDANTIAQRDTATALEWLRRDLRTHVDTEKETLAKIADLEKRTASNDQVIEGIRRYWRVILLGLSLLHPLVYQKVVVATLGFDPLVPVPAIQPVPVQAPAPFPPASSLPLLQP